MPRYNRQAPGVEKAKSECGQDKKPVRDTVASLEQYQNVQQLVLPTKACALHSLTRLCTGTCHEDGILVKKLRNEGEVASSGRQYSMMSARPSSDWVVRLECLDKEWAILKQAIWLMCN